MQVPNYNPILKIICSHFLIPAFVYVASPLVSLTSWFESTVDGQQWTNRTSVRRNESSILIQQHGSKKSYTIFFFLFLYINRMNVGNTISNKGNAIIKPPITAIANGWCNCAPVPMPNAMGDNAVIAPSAVINFGRSLVEIEYTTARSTSWDVLYDS